MKPARGDSKPCTYDDSAGKMQFSVPKTLSTATSMVTSDATHPLTQLQGPRQERRAARAIIDRHRENRRVRLHNAAFTTAAVRSSRWWAF